MVPIGVNKFITPITKPINVQQENIETNFDYIYYYLLQDSQNMNYLKNGSNKMNIGTIIQQISSSIYTSWTKK